MASSDKQKKAFNNWQVAKLLWLAQAFSHLSFGIPLVLVVLFAANVTLPIIQQILIFYLSICFFIYVPFFGAIPFALLKTVGKTLNKIHEKSGTTAKDRLRAVEGLLNFPLYLSLIVFTSSLLGFIFGVTILGLGLIPELLPLDEALIRVGLLIGFATCIVQTFLAYILLEDYFRTQIEKLPSFYFKITKVMKIRKFPFFWKIFFLTFFSVIIAQASLGALYLGNVNIHSPEQLKSALIYVGVVITITWVCVAIITVSFSKNLIYPLKKIIFWADRIIQGKIKEELSIITNDELLEVIEHLRRMYEEIEDVRVTLEIKIKARTKELEELTGRQEETIQERTKEIQKRAEELERFNQLAVGRELKMIELKKEIEKLKKHLRSRSI